MMRRILILFIFLPVFALAQNGSAVFPMPGFFNPLLLRNKNCMTTDNAGRVWIGMRDIGTIIWDGSNWSYFDANNGITDNNVLSVAADANGNVWLGTDTGGVCKYDGFGWQNFSSWNSPLPSSRVLSIAISGTDTWFGTNRGLAKFDGNNWNVYTVQNSSLPGDTVNDIALSAAGELFIATSRGAIHFDGSNWSGFWQNPADAMVTETYWHTDGTEWLISGDQVFKNSNGNFQPFSQLFDIPWPTFEASTKSLGKGPGGGVSFCTNRGTLNEVNGNRFNTYYPYGIVVSNTIAYGLFTLSQSSNEFWFVNFSTTSQTAPYNALMRFDLSSYNGLGLGPTGWNTVDLDVNEVSARMQNRGDMFWDFSSASYHVPKTVTTSTIFAGALWVGGLDTGNTLHQAAMTYRQRGEDYFPGPLDPVTAQADSGTAFKFDRIWKVDQYLISEFQWNFAQGNVQNGTYAVPVDILDWPAIGNFGVTEPLAAFADVNGNGIYDPLAGGDYPLIQGDQELFWVFNDVLAAHSESGGIPLGIEVQTKAWAFLCSAAADSNRAVNYTTFYTYDIINRTQNAYRKTMIGSWVECDLGNWQDDMTGCNVPLNTGFVYNGDAYDDYVPPYGSYLNYPPVQSATVLDGPLAPSSDSIDNDNDGLLDEPGEKMLMTGFYGFNWMSQAYPYTFAANAFDFYGYMDGNWQDSSAITYGYNGQTGSTPTQFMYPDLPYASVGWNEMLGGNPPGDRSMLLSTGKFDFNPGDTIHYTIAMVSSFDSINPWNTYGYFAKAFSDVQAVQQWYSVNSFPSCMPLYDFVPEQNTPAKNPLLLYPNPANDLLTVTYKAEEADAVVQVFDSNGKIIFSGIWPGERLIIPVSAYVPGLYFVRIVDGDQLVSAKFLRSRN